MKFKMTAAGFIAAISSAALIGGFTATATPTQAIPKKTPYEQCMDEIRAICWSEYPPGEERSQCYTDGDTFCTSHYG
ncbi:hypothetical protein [Brevundimonas vesicularis]|uniref:hypothetical protein n=1 Tax=Brevundimonas vesicularis TaxID=41276 RepID=UPI00384D0138